MRFQAEAPILPAARTGAEDLAQRAVRPEPCSDRGEDAARCRRDRVRSGGVARPPFQE